MTNFFTILHVAVTVFIVALTSRHGLAAAPAEIYGFSLEHRASDLLKRYKPIVLNGKAFIHRQHLSRPLDGAEFTYSGETVNSIALSLDAASACATALDALSEQFGAPTLKQDGDVFVAYWDSSSSGLAAYGSCGENPLSFRITLTRKPQPSAQPPKVPSTF